MPLVKLAAIFPAKAIKNKLFNDFRTIVCFLRFFARTGKNNPFPIKTGLNFF